MLLRGWCCVGVRARTGIRASSSSSGSDLPQPPVAPRRADSHDVPELGTSINDDLKWLRDDSRSDESVLQLMRDDNAHFSAHLERVIGDAARAGLYSEMRGRIQEDDCSEAVRRHSFWYFTRTLAAKDYPVHCRCPVRDSLKHCSIGPQDAPNESELAHEQTVLDENQRVEGCEFYEASASVSPDGSLLALAEDTSGDEVFTLRVREIATGREIIEPVNDTSGNIVWMNDSRTLLYTTKDSLMRPFKVWRFTVGEDQQQQEHELLFHENDDAFFIGIGKTRSEQLISIGCSSQVTSDVLALKACDTTGQFTRLVQRMHNVEVELDHSGDSLFLYRRSEDSPNGEVLAARLDMQQPLPTAGDLQQSIVHIIAHRLDTQIEDFVLSSNYMLLQTRVDALPKIILYELSALKQQRTEMVGMPVSFPKSMEVCEAELSDCGDFESDVFRAVVTSPSTPATTFDFHASNPGKTSVKRVRPVKGDFDSERYEVRRINVPSHDGREVPATLTWRTDTAKLDGCDPCFMIVYGAYGMNMQIDFSSNLLSLLDRGMIVCHCHIRGGSERGRSWYEQEGKFFTKKNSFEDTVAIAQYLEMNKWTSRERLCIEGGSAGGMTVGASLNIEPSLWRVAIMDVPFVDCVATMLDESIPLTVIEFDEWGNPKESKEMFDYMLSYSPMNNIKQGAKYPAMMVTSGLHDPRVQYWEPLKYVQKVRELASQDDPARPVVHRVQMSAGHSSVSGRFQALNEEAMKFAFALHHLGFKLAEFA